MDMNYSVERYSFKLEPSKERRLVTISYQMKNRVLPNYNGTQKKESNTIYNQRIKPID